MGYGNYSQAAHEALTQARAAKPAEQVFVQRACHPLMNPKGVLVRECRDSADHPESTPIVFALDVTGSMGEIPKSLATSSLPRFMKVLTDCGVPDPQILFLAVGDATCDNAPLQVGQFESTAELMDQWLTRSFLEGGGGANKHESYELALYFLAEHTETDAWVKRGKKGYVFMTGDELPYDVLSKHVVDGIIGDRVDDDLKVAEVVAELQKSYEPFFLIPDPRRRGAVEDTWRALLGDHVLCMNAPMDTCFVAAGAVLLNEAKAKDLEAVLDTLVAAGLAEGRRGLVAQALTPLAQLHGKAGSWTERLMNAFKP
jgi:hypothetical protein